MPEFAPNRPVLYVPGRQKLDRDPVFSLTIGPQEAGLSVPTPFADRDGNFKTEIEAIDLAKLGSFFHHNSQVVICEAPQDFRRHREKLERFVFASAGWLLLCHYDTRPVIVKEVYESEVDITFGSGEILQSVPAPRNG